MERMSNLRSNQVFMGYLKAALYLDVILTLAMILFFIAFGGFDSVIPMLPMLLVFGVASGPIVLFISWVYESFWSQ